MIFNKNYDLFFCVKHLFQRELYTHCHFSPPQQNSPHLAQSHACFEQVIHQMHSISRNKDLYQLKEEDRIFYLQ